MRVAVIGTFYRRYENSLPLLRRLYRESTRRPDEAWLMCETDSDRGALEDAAQELGGYLPGLRIVVEPTPRDGKRYRVIPYANKINWALERQSADAIVYLDNNSMPETGKLEAMAAGLEENPGWGAVYCCQRRLYPGSEQLAKADIVVGDGYCALNFTQVMHRPTDARWPLDMKHADPDLADGLFWRELHERLGDFYPVGEPEVPLDVHVIPDSKAQGLDG